MDEPEVIDAADLPPDVVANALTRAIAAGRKVPLKLDGDVVGTTKVIAENHEGYVFEGVIGRAQPIIDGASGRHVGEAFVREDRDDAGRQQFSFRYTQTL